MTVDCILSNHIASYTSQINGPKLANSSLENEKESLQSFGMHYHPNLQSLCWYRDRSSKMIISDIPTAYRLPSID